MASACEHPECVDDATSTIMNSGDTAHRSCLRHTIELARRMSAILNCGECKKSAAVLLLGSQRLCLACAESELARRDAANAMLKIDVCPRCGISYRDSKVHSDCTHCGECHVPEQAHCPICWICEKIHAPACEEKPASAFREVKVKPVQPSSTLVLCDRCDEWINTNSAAQHMCEDNSLKVVNVLQFPACPICFNSTNDAKKSYCDTCVKNGFVCTTCSIPMPVVGECKTCERKKSSEVKRRHDFDAACDRHFAKKAAAMPPQLRELCIVARCDQPMTEQTHFCEKHLSTAKGGV